MGTCSCMTALPYRQAYGSRDDTGVEMLGTLISFLLIETTVFILALANFFRKAFANKQIFVTPAKIPKIS